MQTTEQMRAKLDEMYHQTLATGQPASFTISSEDLAVIVKMDLEDALRALGTSQRVLKARVYIVDAMKACNALLEDMRAKEYPSPSSTAVLHSGLRR